MDLTLKRFFLVFVPTFFFLGFFPGAYLYYHFQNDMYSWYDGIKKQSDFSIVYSGFMNFGRLLFTIVLSVLYALLVTFILSKENKTFGKRYFILNAIFLTVLLSAIYFLYQMLSLIGLDSVFVQKIMNEYLSQAFILGTCYFIIALAVSFFFFRLKPPKPIEEENRPIT